MEFFVPNAQNDNCRGDDDDERAYQPRSAFVAVPQGIVQGSSIPLRVALAMQFVQLCNRYTHPEGFVCGKGNGEIGAEIIRPDLYGPQEQALREACWLLGKFFRGKDIPSDELE